jgi:hypothetical protein
VQPHSRSGRFADKTIRLFGIEPRFLLCDRITWHNNYDIPALLYYMSVGKIGWTMRATADSYNEFSCVQILNSKLANTGPVLSSVVCAISGVSRKLDKNYASGLLLSEWW